MDTKMIDDLFEGGGGNGDKSSQFIPLDSHHFVGLTQDDNRNNNEERDSSAESKESEGSKLARSMLERNLNVKLDTNNNLTKD